MAYNRKNTKSNSKNNNDYTVTMQMAAVNFISSMVAWHYSVKNTLELNKLILDFFPDLSKAKSDTDIVDAALEAVFPGSADVPINTIKYHVDKFRKTNDYLISKNASNKFALKGIEFCDEVDKLLA